MAIINGTQFNDNNTINGGKFRPSLVGTDQADKIYGKAGNDYLSGVGGNDDLYSDMDNNKIQDQSLSVELTAQELAEVLGGTLKDNKSFLYGIINPDIFQKILKPVVRPVKSIVLATLMTVSFSFAMTILNGTSQVSANPLQSQQANHLQINNVITSPPSIVGNWKGSLYSEGDDASTSVELVINQGAIQQGQGTWKFIGENNSAFESGAVVASLAGNNASLEFKQKNKKPSWYYKCKLQNNKKLSCEEVGNTLWKLTLNKAN